MAFANPQEPKVRLSKDEALEKWGSYTDSAIRRSGLSLEKQIDGLVAAGATEESLKFFWREVKHLSWPGSFGQSPWELASTLGAALEAQDLGPEFRAVGRDYIGPFREAVARQIEEASSNSKELTMVVDLDERGSFRAHVEDQKGKSVFEFSNEGENGWPEEDGLWLVSDGFMKHCRDSDGLHDYLLSVGIAKPGSSMRVEG